MSDSITVSSPPTTAEVSARIMAYMAAQTGVATDTQPGAQFRTNSEAIGQIAETAAVSAQALAYQAIVYGCMSVFGITPIAATSAQGTVTFATGTSSLPAATQNVTIAKGTIVQSTSGIQYQTTETVTLASGATSISATAEAVNTGTSGNTTSGTISIIVSSVAYPLYVSNSAAFTGGAAEEAISETLSRFVAKVASIGLASPVAIANACIGVTASGSTEEVLYATVYEPWTTGVTSDQNLGYIVYIDNGSGTASASLITAVTSTLNGSYSSGESGYRDAGVPYSVVVVTPTNYSVVVTGVLSDSTQDSSMTTLVEEAVQTYQTSLQFGQTISRAAITAAVGDVLADLATSFSVTLLDSTSTSQATIVVSSISRGYLSSITCTLS